jgi:hypothetical protein
MADPIVKVLGIDIYALGLVSDLSNLSELRTFQKNKLISNEYSFQVDNINDFFSIDNSASPFSGTKWAFKPVVITGTKGEITWEGELLRIERNHNNKTATIYTRDTLNKIKDSIITYQSSTFEDGATAFENICNAYGYTNLNQASIDNSKVALQNAGCYIKVDIKASDGITFLSAVNKIADYSNAEIYQFKNKTFFKHWTQPVLSASYTITDSDYVDFPVITQDNRSLINDYSIGYFNDAGTPATDANSNNIGVASRSKYSTRSLPALYSNAGQVVFKDKVSASYIGDGYIKRNHVNFSTNNPGYPQRIEFSTKLDISDALTLDTRLRLQLTDENWTAKYVDPFAFTILEDQDLIKIISYEVAT